MTGGLEIPGDEAVRLFVGSNYPYYRRKWDAMARRRSGNSWNWAAFFMGPFWLAWRKMYLWAGLFVVVAILDELAQYFRRYDSGLTRPIYIALYITFALQGNALYKRHVEKGVAAVLNGRPVEEAREDLARRGGTSWAGVVVVLAVFSAVAYFFNYYLPAAGGI